MDFCIQYNSSDGIILDAVIREHPLAKNSILMVHGINSDKNEEGLFVRLSEKLETHKYNILRFDFRCHGNSIGPIEYMTIKGETEDLINTIALAKEKWTKPIIIVAASFGAVAVLNSVSQALFRSVIGVVLLNPVLDLKATFLDSRFEWPRESFNEDAYRQLNEIGYFRLDGKLKIGQQLFDEIHHIKPYKNLAKIEIPVLIIHGNADRYVPYDISKNYSLTVRKCEFVTITGADHGFGNPEDERQAINSIQSWINRL